MCANGLLSGLDKHLSLPKGFYSAMHILIVLGSMALARIRRPEGLRHLPPGELGKGVGLDRVPEVSTLRDKIAVLAQQGSPREWMLDLSRQWMGDDPLEAGYLYVDGHVRVYHGSSALVPKRYVSRERLCLRGTTSVVNPAWRTLDKAASDTRRKIRKRQASFASVSFHAAGDDIELLAQLHQDIQALEADLADLRVKRRTTPRKVPIASLPENERPGQLLPLGKMLTDTIKMIAYRAETALVALLRPHLAKEDEARAMIRELFVSSADLVPDETANTLTVRIHRMASPAHDKGFRKLLENRFGTDAIARLFSEHDVAPEKSIVSSPT